MEVENRIQNSQPKKLSVVSEEIDTPSPEPSGDVLQAEDDVQLAQLQRCMMVLHNDKLMWEKLLVDASKSSLSSSVQELLSREERPVVADGLNDGAEDEGVANIKALLLRVNKKLDNSEQVIDNLNRMLDAKIKKCSINDSILG